MLEGIDLRNGKGIEIGPLTSPVVTKEQSDVRYVDWTDQQGLRARYATDPNVDGSKIVPVDAIWGDLSLKASLSGEVGFDYVIASHVIEHVPDMIGWLTEVAEVLRPGGRLSLAVPDRRYTFDHLRQETRLGDLVEAWLRRNRRPAPASVFDFAANAAWVDVGEAWRGVLDPAGLRHFVDLPRALQMSREAFEGTYHDAHCWVFTPPSLLRLLADLLDLDLLPYRCACFHDTEPGSLEMLMVLERLAGDADGEKAAARESFMAHLRPLAAADAAASREVPRLNGVVEGMAARIATLEAEVAGLRTSTSWRLTQPLRAVGTRLPGLLRAGRKIES